MKVNPTKVAVAVAVAVAIGSNNVVKNADKKTKEAWDFVICAIKHTIDNIKKLDKTLSGDDVVDDDNHDDEEEKPKKNKKKATKKKKNEDDEDEE